MITIESTTEGVKITMPEEQREEFITHMTDIFAQSVDFTERCCGILVERYGAKRELIEPSQFYYQHGSDLIEHNISGRKIRTPMEVVERAVSIMRPQYLGLAEHGGYAETIRKQQAEYQKLIASYSANRGA